MTPIDKAEGDVNEIPMPVEQKSNRPRGADIGNGYTIGYKELMGLSRLRKAGVDTETFFAEPKVPPPSTWTLGNQITAMEMRRHKTLLQKKHKMMLQAKM